MLSSLRAKLLGQPKTQVSVEESLGDFSVIPDEILLQNLSYLDTHTLLMLRAVSVHLNRLATDTHLWQERFLKSYPDAPIITYKKTQNNAEAIQDFFASYLQASQTYFSKATLEGKYILNLVRGGDVSRFENSPEKRKKLAEWLLHLLKVSEADEINDNESLNDLNPFYYAYKKGHQSILDYFYGIFEEYYGKQKAPELFKMALHCHQIEVINKASFHELSTKGILIAVTYQYTDFLKRFAQTSPYDGPTAKTDIGYYFLLCFLAAKYNKITALEVLLPNDMRIINYKDQYNRNIFQIAAEYKQAEAISVLFKKYDILEKLISQTFPIYTDSGQGKTKYKNLLHLAIEKNSRYTKSRATKTLLTLLRNCNYETFNPNVQSNYSSQTILHLAVKEELVEVIEELAKFKKLDASVTNDHQKTAFDLALAKEGKYKDKNKIISLLLEREDFALTLQRYLEGKTRSKRKADAAINLKNYIETKQKEKNPLLFEDLQKLYNENEGLRGGSLQKIYNRVIYFPRAKAEADAKNQAAVINNKQIKKNDPIVLVKALPLAKASIAPVSIFSNFILFDSKPTLRDEISINLKKEIETLAKEPSAIKESVIGDLLNLRFELENSKEESMAELIKGCKVNVFSKSVNVTSHSIFSANDSLDPFIKAVLAYLDRLIIVAEKDEVRKSNKLNS